MGSGIGFSKFLIVTAKVVVIAVLFAGIGVPFITGAAMGLLVMLLNVLSSLFLALFSNPIGLFLVGALSLIVFNRRRRKRAVTAAVNVENGQD